MPHSSWKSTRRGQGKLYYAPVVDMKGYTFVTQRSATVVPGGRCGRAADHHEHQPQPRGGDLVELDGQQLDLERRDDDRDGRRRALPGLAGLARMGRRRARDALLRPESPDALPAPVGWKDFAIPSPAWPGAAASWNPYWQWQLNPIGEAGTSKTAPRYCCSIATPGAERTLPHADRAGRGWCCALGISPERPIGHGVSAGGGLFAMYNAPWLLTAPWDGSAVVDMSTTFSGQQGFPFIFDDFVVWSASNYPHWCKLVAYTPTLGSYPFIDYGAGYQCAHALGTDGVDMVWLHFFDKQASRDPWGGLDIMTAPFTKNPSRDRPATAAQLPRPSAAHRADLRRLRLRRGEIRAGQGAHRADRRWISWELPQVGCAIGVNQDSWCWDPPIAVTCDEVFIGKALANVTSVARVQLSSLGAPTPPD